MIQYQEGPMTKSIFPTIGLTLVSNISLLEIPLNQGTSTHKATNCPKKCKTLSLYN